MVFVIILAYNEEACIGRLLEEVNQNLSSQSIDHSLIVVNDGSTDRTAGIVESLADRVPSILLNHEINQGVARAFNTGLRKAAALAKPDDVIITIEGDYTNDASLIARMARRIERGDDVVCASRYQSGGGYVGFPLTRLILSRGANLLLRLIFPVGSIRDYTIFFRAYRASIIQSALEFYGERFIQSQGFASNAEILMKLRRFRPRTSEEAMVYRYDLKKTRSTMRVYKTIREYLKFIRRNLITPRKL